MSHQKSFEPRIEVDNVMLDEQLWTWYPANVGELSGVIETLKLVKEDIVDCDGEFDHLWSSYHAYVDHPSPRRQELIHYAARLSGLLSPIRRLPHETLCEILLYCCSPNDIRDGEPGAALILSSVCFRFREVAISYSALWSNLEVFFPPDCAMWEFFAWSPILDPETPEKEIKLTSLIQLYLDRSNNRPLTLDLNIYQRRSLTEHPSLQLLARESNRWKHLVYRGGAFEDPAAEIPSLDHRSFPLLKSIDFGMLHPPKVFLVAPNLNHIGFCANLALADNDILDFTNTWKSLTHLTYPFRKAEFINCWRALDLCPNLTSLTLEGWNPKLDNQLTITPPPRSFPTLSSLAVINNGSNELDDSLECIMSSLITPSLSELVLEQRSAANHPQQSFYYIDRFIKRSLICSLTTLVFQGLHIRDQDMVKILLRVPSVQNLTIQDPAGRLDIYSSYPISKFFIENLHARRKSPWHQTAEPLVPNLRKLTLKVETEGFNPWSFVDTIASRWLLDEPNAVELGLVRLRSVELHLPGKVDAKPYEGLKQFEKDGLRVAVKCRGVDGHIA